MCSMSSTNVKTVLKTKIQNRKARGDKSPVYDHINTKYHAGVRRRKKQNKVIGN